MLDKWGDMVYNEYVERTRKEGFNMSDSVLVLLVFFGFILFIAFMVFLELKISDFIHNGKEAKRRKEHPEFFRLYEEYDEKGNTACHFHNTEIAPRKRKVDAMLKEEPYWPQQVREQKIEEVEKLRREIYTAECMYKGLNKETEEVRKKVADYVHTHNIKWAGDWD